MLLVIAFRADWLFAIETVDFLFRFQLVYELKLAMWTCYAVFGS